MEGEFQSVMGASSSAGSAARFRALGDHLMPTYHLYYLSKGAIVGSDSIEADDDSEAARLARAMNEGDAVELWNDCRRLGVLRAAPSLASLSAGLGSAVGAGHFLRQEQRSPG